MADVKYVDVTSLSEAGSVQAGDVLLLIRKGADGNMTCYKVLGTNFKGEAGATGAKGADGKSAYDVAVEQGYTGTAAEWEAHIKLISGDIVTYDADTGEIVINS